MLAIGVLAGWLRLRDLDLVEFKLDEATAVNLARRLLDGDFPTVGLRSSVAAYNPPLFVYLTAVPLAVWDDPRAATAFVGMLAVVAVILTYIVLRPRFGALAALGAAALFATAPWAVLYGRKLWGQSVLPVVAVALLWSMFTLLERSRSRAVVFIPVLLCLAFQLNFSASALVIPATVLLLYRAREVHWPAFATRFRRRGAAACSLAVPPGDEWVRGHLSARLGILRRGEARTIRGCSRVRPADRDRRLGVCGGRQLAGVRDRCRAGVETGEGCERGRGHTVRARARHLRTLRRPWRAHQLDAGRGSR